MEAPNERRDFVHKRIIGAVGGFVQGGFTGAARGFIRGGGRASSRSGGQPTVVGRRLGGGGRGQFRTGGAIRVGSGRGCTRPLVQDLDGTCRFPSSPADVSVGGAMSGVAVQGRHGAALSPTTDVRTVRECLPGMVLGNDGLCYGKRDIRNRDRMHPKGRKPLGTPGELAALAKAASFGRRMEGTVKRMQKIGVLKKPAPRRIKAPATTHLLGPGPH